MPETIHFFTEKIPFNIPGKRILRRWIEAVVRNEKKEPGALNFIICDDPYLQKLNKKYLKKNTLTDIITFPLADEDKLVSGDIYISIDRVRENSRIYKEQVKKELARVMVHGVLHLMGYLDETEPDQDEMRKKEDRYLKELTLW